MKTEGKSMRDIKALHPDLQKKYAQLIKLCSKKGIKIGVAECLRTKAEQDALYTKGRTAPGKIVTNAKGSSYSSMHQWGVAFDFYLKIDIDGDGQISDDAYNNAKKTFNQVGALAKSIGLEWGGDWKSIKDLPHIQLKDWGSTTTKLKAKYGTPEKFMKTWQGATGQAAATEKSKEAAKSTKRIESAQSFDKRLAGSYKTKCKCYLMAGTRSNGIVASLDKGAELQCYGYHTAKNGKKYLYVKYGKKEGFVTSTNLKK